MNTASARIPHISNTQRLLIIIPIMFTALLLLWSLTQMVDKTNPTNTDAIFTPAQTERTPSDNAMFNKDGIKVANGNTLMTTAAILIFLNFLFSIIELPHFFFTKACNRYYKYQSKNHHCTRQKRKQLKSCTVASCGKIMQRT